MAHVLYSSGEIDFCPLDPRLQKPSNAVYCHAIWNLTENHHFQEDTTLPYSAVLLNVGDALNRETNTFRAPVAGYYFFSYSASTNSNIRLRINGTSIARKDTLLQALKLLQAGEEVEARVSGGYFLRGGDENRFIGMLLNRDSMNMIDNQYD